MTFKSWKWNEIHPYGVFLATSGSTEIRILFWHEIELDSSDCRISELKKNSVFQNNFQVNNEFPRSNTFENNTMPSSNEKNFFFDSHLESVKTLLLPIMLTDNKLINLKIDNLIYVGMTFSLVPDEIEKCTLFGINQAFDSSKKLPKFTLDSQNDESDSSLNNLFQNYKTPKLMTTFSVIFVLSSLTSSCLQQSYAQLAKAIGVQLRRAEVFWGYLSTQQEIIVKCTEEISMEQHENRMNADLIDSSNNPSGNSLARKTIESNEMFDGKIGSDQKYSTEAIKFEISQTDYLKKRKNMKNILLLKSSLFQEIVEIFEEACRCGIINTKIKNFYPVYFTIPHKAYCLPVDTKRLDINHSIDSPIIGLEPRLVFHAIERIRPYHSLVFLYETEVIIDRFLPPDVNTTVINFIKTAISTKSFEEMSINFFGIERTLDIAKFIILRGLAILIYPVCRSNVYVLNPQDSRLNLIQPITVLDFAGKFPEINLASVLSSFSVPMSIDEHLETAKMMEPMTKLVKKADLKGENNFEEFIQKNNIELEFGKSTSNFWIRLSNKRIVELIGFLISKRLIIQLHKTIFCLKNSYEPYKDSSMSLITTDSSSPNSNLVKSLSSSGLSRRRSAPLINYYGSKHLEDQMKMVPREVKIRICQLFPSQFSQSVLLNRFSPQNFSLNLPDHGDGFKILEEEYIQSMKPEKEMNWLKLMDFLEIYAKLPCHLEKLIYELGKSKSEINAILQKYSCFIRICLVPDNLTSIFSGLPVCDVLQD